tara:strand:- start:1955 stop:2857 length:903 start_codon:yes stop_codon:yes gene_type:complete
MSDSLKTDKTIDKHLHMLKTESGEISSLSVSTEGNGAKVTGDLTVTGTVDIKTEGTLNANEIKANNVTGSAINIGADIDLSANTDIGISATRDLVLSANDGTISSSNPIFIKESASALGDTTAFGQIWVRSSSPNDLYFTDDTGQDVRITQNGNVFTQYHYETKIIGWNNSGTSQVYLPITGYIVDVSGTASRNEYVGMVAPYTGTIERAMFRCEEAQNGTLEFDIYESSDGTENPGSVSGVKDTAIDIADDTSVEIDFSSMTSGTNAFVKGRIYAFRVDTPSAPNDANMTLVFKWDVTS